MSSARHCSPTTSPPDPPAPACPVRRRRAAAVVRGQGLRPSGAAGSGSWPKCYGRPRRRTKTSSGGGTALGSLRAWAPAWSSSTTRRGSSPTGGAARRATRSRRRWSPPSRPDASAWRPAPGADRLPDSWWLRRARRRAARWWGPACARRPFAPYPVFLLHDARRSSGGAGPRAARARRGGRRGERGAAGRRAVCAAETARLTGGGVRVAEQTRLHELGGLVEPPHPGRAAAAAPREDEVGPGAGVVRRLRSRRRRAGRPRRAAHRAAGRPAAMLGPVGEGRVWLWEDA